MSPALGARCLTETAPKTSPTVQQGSLSEINSLTVAITPPHLT